jgi:hypothetical protein
VCHLPLELYPLLVELDLSERLIRERHTHDERQMPGGASEVEQPSPHEQQNRMAIGEGPIVELRLDIRADNPGHFRGSRGLDFLIEMPDVSDDCLVLHSRHVVDRNNIAIPNGGTKISASPTTSSVVRTWYSSIDA